MRERPGADLSRTDVHFQLWNGAERLSGMVCECPHGSASCSLPNHTLSGMLTPWDVILPTERRPTHL